MVRIHAQVESCGKVPSASKIAHIRDSMDAVSLLGVEDHHLIQRTVVLAVFGGSLLSFLLIFGVPFSWELFNPNSEFNYGTASY